MKTISITLIRTRAKNEILSLLALIAAIPAVAQINYTATNSNKFSPQNTFTVAGPRYIKINTLPYHISTSSDENLYGNDKSMAARANKNSKPGKAVSSKANNKSNSEATDITFKPTSFAYPKNARNETGLAHFSTEQLMLYAKSLKQYAKKNGFDTSYAFLSNMGMQYNKKRFFVINLTTMKIEQSGLVAQGRGKGVSIYDKQYSNKADSKCTSLGRYKISGMYKGGYGKAYKVHGLDTSNSNAYKRNIVLHPMGCIPDKEGIAPACVSEGCPAVSAKFFNSLSKIIESRKKPVLMWVFDSNLEEIVPERTNSGSVQNIPVISLKI
jgi:L,D-transpeptidase catalytic domain